MDCSFCEKKINKGTEFIFVTKKGKALYFCSSKCFRNMVYLDRKPRKIKWTNAYRVEKDARLKLLAQKEKPQKQKSEEAVAKEPITSETRKQKAHPKHEVVEAGRDGAAPKHEAAEAGRDGAAPKHEAKPESAKKESKSAVKEKKAKQGKSAKTPE